MGASLIGWLERQWWSPTTTGGARALGPLAWLYETLALRERHHARPLSLPVPVIVVGNLVVGGAGKTPTTIALVQALQQRGLRPGVISRGFGRTARDVQWVSSTAAAREVGDEPRLIHRRTGVPVVVGRDRVAAGLALLAGSSIVDVIVADDGLQHHRLARDAQVIVIDERGFGNGRLLPAGPLRERATVELPDRSVVLYNAPRPTAAWPGWLAKRRMHTLVSLTEWHADERRDRPVTAQPIVPDSLRHGPVIAAAGIASPTRFFTMLEDLGLHFSRLALPDHFDWQHWPQALDEGAVIVTEKDAVKLAPDHPRAARIWVAPLDFTLPEPLIDAVLAMIDPKRAATQTPS